MTSRLSGLTGATLETAPSVCHECVWWQSRGTRQTDKRRWIEKTEKDWGVWGQLYYDDDGRLLGSMQYGPGELFPRAAELPAGPPTDDAVLVTCAYLVESSAPWVIQSLFLAAIGDAKDRGARALEAFAYRFAEGESVYERFRVHRTVFPARLPVGSRLPHRARAGPGRAGPPRPRRAGAGAGRPAGRGAAPAERALRARPGTSKALNDALRPAERLQTRPRGPRLPSLRASSQPTARAPHPERSLRGGRASAPSGSPGSCW